MTVHMVTHMGKRPYVTEIQAQPWAEWIEAFEAGRLFQGDDNEFAPDWPDAHAPRLTRPKATTGGRCGLMTVTDGHQTSTHPNSSVPAGQHMILDVS